MNEDTQHSHAVEADEMDKILAEARNDSENPLLGVRLFVRDGKDTTLDDIKRAFCAMENAFKKDSNRYFKLVASASPSAK